MEKDELDTNCTCPDFVVHSNLRIRTMSSQLYWFCHCCHLPIDRDHPYFTTRLVK